MLHRRSPLVVNVSLHSMNDLKKYLFPFLVGVAIVAIGIVTFQIGRAGGYQIGYDDALNLPHVLDTVWRTKLVTIEKPVPVVQWKEREKLVYVPKDSLIYVHDTVPALPREYKQYSGENYSALVSGIAPSLDWININQQTAQNLGGIGNLTAVGTVSASDASFQALELKPSSASAGNGGYIDFHYNNSSSDYTTRIIENASGTIQIRGNAQVTGSLTSGGN